MSLSNIKLSGDENDYTLIISDLEGDSILKFFNDINSFEKFINNINNNIIITGDIIDSTTGFGLNINNCLDTKSNNINNLLLISKYNNIHLILGNRDLNKLKCLSLCKLEEPETRKRSATIGGGDDSLIRDFNNGNINLEND